MVELLLGIAFARGLFVAFMHVANRRFIAPLYDLIANLTGFVCATAASTLVGHWVAAALAASAVGCWLWPSRRTALSVRAGQGPMVNARLSCGLASAPCPEQARCACRLGVASRAT